MQFLSSSGCVNSTAWMHHVDTMHIEKKIGTAQECYELYWTNPGSNSCMATYLLSLKPSKWDEQGIWETAGELKTNL